MPDAEAFSEQPRPPQQADDAPATKPSAPGKNIFVCCDGTGNEFEGKGGKHSNSNVVKFYTALELRKEQVAYYHPGVGTLGDPTEKGIRRALSVVNGLAFGQGFEENVLDAYRYLMQHYSSGDTVYLLGFSRGAYTVRALAGLLHGYGLLCRGNEGHIPYAWNMYTQRIKAVGHKSGQTLITDFSFRDTFSHRDFMVHFVGMWDTVSSVGWISTPVRLLHLAQNPSIAYGRHAVSIDERRCYYQDNLWGPPVLVQVPAPLIGQEEERNIPPVQDMLQVWFSGVHSDVGGSYPQVTSGLSNVSLKWMMDEAEKLGARFDAVRRDVVQGMAVQSDPKMPVKDLAGIYERPTSTEVHRSLKKLWWLLEVFPHRYFERDDTNVKVRVPFGSWRRIPDNAVVHPSVVDQMGADPGYRPPNLMVGTLKEFTVPTKAGHDVYFRFSLPDTLAGRLRENVFVVAAVSMVELAFGVFLLLLLAWFGLRVLTAEWLQVTAAASVWGASRFAHWLALPHWWWRGVRVSLVAAVVVVLVRRGVAYLRQK